MDKETNKQTIPKLYNFVSKSSVLITVTIRKKKKKQFPNDKEDKPKFNPAFNY